MKSDSPWKTFEEFIAFAKANPGKIRYSTSGVGTGQHLVMEYLAMKENIKWTHVPFATSPQAVAAVMGGHVEVTSQTPEWKEQVDAGQMRLLVCWNDKRMPFYPAVPTLKEKGYDFAVQALIVIYAISLSQFAVNISQLRQSSPEDYPVRDVQVSSQLLQGAGFWAATDHPILANSGQSRRNRANASRPQ